MDKRLIEETPESLRRCVRRINVGCALRTEPWIIEAYGAQGAPYEE